MPTQTHAIDILQRFISYLIIGVGGIGIIFVIITRVFIYLWFIRAPRQINRPCYHPDWSTLANSAFPGNIVKLNWPGSQAAETLENAPCVSSLGHCWSEWSDSTLADNEGEGVKDYSSEFAAGAFKNCSASASFSYNTVWGPWYTCACEARGTGTRRKCHGGEGSLGSQGAHRQLSWSPALAYCLCRPCLDTQGLNKYHKRSASYCENSTLVVFGRWWSTNFLQ